MRGLTVISDFKYVQYSKDWLQKITNEIGSFTCYDIKESILQSNS